MGKKNKGSKKASANNNDNSSNGTSRTCNAAKTDTIGQAKEFPAESTTDVIPDAISDVCSQDNSIAEGENPIDTSESVTALLSVEVESEGDKVSTELNITSESASIELPQEEGGSTSEDTTFVENNPLLEMLPVSKGLNVVPYLTPEQSTGLDGKSKSSAATAEVDALYKPKDETSFEESNPIIDASIAQSKPIAVKPLPPGSFARVVSFSNKLSAKSTKPADLFQFAAFFGYGFGSIFVYTSMAIFEFSMWAFFQWVRLAYYAWSTLMLVIASAFMLQVNFVKAIAKMIATSILSVIVLLLNRLPGHAYSVPKVLNGKHS